GGFFMEAKKRRCLQLVGFFGQVFSYDFRGSVHTFIGFLSASRAHFAVGFGELQGLYHTCQLIKVTAQRQRVVCCSVDRAFFGYVFSYAFRRSLHTFIAFLPASRARFAVGFVELQGFNQTHQLINVTAQRQVVDVGSADHAFFVDQERTTQRPATGGFYVV